MWASKLGQPVGAWKKGGVGGTPITNYCTHSLNILLERIERNSFFKIGEQFNVFFYFQFIAEKNDRLELYEISETHV